jgi:hypothetical protein
MESLVYDINGKLFNTFADFAKTEQPVSTSFNKFNKCESSRFTQVAALGKLRNYSRVEMLHSIFN